MTTPALKPPEIPAAEQTPLVQHLLQIIVQQQEEIQALKEGAEKKGRGQRVRPE